MKTALHLMVAAGLLGLQVSVPAAVGCSLGIQAACCCAPPSSDEAPVSCCSADPAQETPEPMEHDCTCSVGPGPVVPSETNPAYVMPSSSSLVHIIHVIPVLDSCLDTSLSFGVSGRAWDTGPPGDSPPVYQLNCVYLR